MDEAPGRTPDLGLSISELDRILKGDPKLLHLDAEGAELAGRPCIATGALNEAGPYPKVAAGLFSRQVNYIDFGFDWRKIAGVAEGYLQLFLQYLEEAAEAAGRSPPLSGGDLGSQPRRARSQAVR